MPDITSTLTASFNSAFYGVVNFIPKFFAGLIIFLIGIIIASIVKQVIVGISKTVKLEAFLKKYGITDKSTLKTWIKVNHPDRNNSIAIQSPTIFTKVVDIGRRTFPNISTII